MKLKPLVLGLVFLALSKAQVDIHEKSKDGYIRVPINETAGTSEIYTSMYQLEKFFEDEKAYVEDIKLMIEKKLVTQGAVTGDLYFSPCKIYSCNFAFNLHFYRTWRLPCIL